MELSIREAAVLLGRHPRTLRGQLARGEIHGVKKGRQWRISRDDLPLTEAQRRRLEDRAVSVREALESALPARLVNGARGGRRSVLDLDTFCGARDLLHAMRSSDDILPEALTTHLQAAVHCIAEAVHAYDPGQKAHALESARKSLSQCTADLYLASVDPESRHHQWARVIEDRLIPSLSGLLRWCERKRRKQR